MRILAISTSTSRGSAAVVVDGRVVGASCETDLEGHAAERIFEAIREALASAGLSSSSLDAFACDIGPGSFTGVRVGVSAGKGMALGRGAALVGVSSLEAMAQSAFASGFAGSADVVVAGLDAKKQEVFVAAFDASGRAVFSPRHLPTASSGRVVLDQVAPLVPLGGRLWVVGEVFASEALLVPYARGGLGLDLPDAAVIGQVASRRLLAGGVADFDPALVEPLYVRPPDAKPMAQTDNP